MKYAIGIAFEGVNVASGIVNQYGDLIQQELSHANQFDADKLYDSVVKCVEKLLVHSSIPFNQINGIGISVPGSIDKMRNRVDCKGILPWSDFPLADRLCETFKTNKFKISTDSEVVSIIEKKVQHLSIFTIESNVIGAGLSMLED